MILFNETPKVHYDIDDLTKEEISTNGYALPSDGIEFQMENSAVLHFMNVDEHIDGNGLSILWLINGEGTFFIEDKEYFLNKGDVLVFDDNIEHGFYSDTFCTAINFTIEEIGLVPEKIKELVQSYNTLHQNIHEEALSGDNSTSLKKTNKIR